MVWNFPLDPIMSVFKDFRFGSTLDLWFFSSEMLNLHPHTNEDDSCRLQGGQCCGHTHLPPEVMVKGKPECLYYTGKPDTKGEQLFPEAYKAVGKVVGCVERLVVRRLSRVWALRPTYLVYSEVSGFMFALNDLQGPCGLLSSHMVHIARGSAKQNTQ